MRDRPQQPARRPSSVADRLSALIQERGLKRSRPRDVIVEVFSSMGGHVTVEKLARRVRERDAGIGVATVYRTMKLLTELGLATARQFGADGQTRYEAAGPERHHDHIICTRCGAIVEFENPDLEALQLRIARRHGFRLAGHRVELYGECGACREAAAPARAEQP